MQDRSSGFVESRSVRKLFGFGFGSHSQLLCHRSVVLRCFAVSLGGVAVASSGVAVSKSVDARIVGGFLVNFRGPRVYDCGFVKTLGGAKTCLPSAFPHVVGCASCELRVIGGIIALPHGADPTPTAVIAARISPSSTAR